MTSHRLFAGVFVAVSWTAALNATDYPLPSGYPNYYFNELHGVDWAVNAKVVAGPASVGANFPVSVPFQFEFAWNSVDGSGNNEDVFTEYSRGTPFDLVTAPETTNVYTYAQSAPVGPTIAHSPTRAIVRFQPLVLTAPSNSTVTTLFEIYGDCLRCEANQEARPPDLTRTTWRIFGKIRVTADASGRLTSFDIIDLGSDVPQKQLDNQGGVQHDPNWYPQRKLARRSSIDPLWIGPAVFNARGERGGSYSNHHPCECPCVCKRRCILRRGCPYWRQSSLHR
jgi:hypothetical protein